MIDSLILLITAFSLGLLGSIHCIGMCGGIMGALTMAIPVEQKGKRLSLIIIYNTGRIISYAIAGFLVGLIGWSLEKNGFAIGLRYFAGIMLLIMGLYLAGWWAGLTYTERLGSLLWKRIQPIASKLLPVKNIPQAFALGFLWGWLPCGLVYGTLPLAANHGTPHLGALVMIAFGLGTWPALIISGIAAQALKQFLQKKHVRRLFGIIIMLFGIWTIPGPHQHWLMGH